MSTDPISKYDSHGTNYCAIHHDTYLFIKPESGSLVGRYVLITGASKGIGKQTALSYARAGASGIALISRSSPAATEAEVKEIAKAAGNPDINVVTATGDVNSKEQMREAGEIVRKAFDGKLDILILNAGALDPFAFITKQDPTAWWDCFSTNVLGAYVCLNIFLPLLRAKEGGLGTVIGTSSIGATFAGLGFTATPISKLALSRLMESVNRENEIVGPDATPILAYSIHPGGVDHPDRADIPDAMRAMTIDTPVLGADATVWLTKERRDWLAGRYISVNWDFEEFLGKRQEIEKRDLLKFRLAMGGEDQSKF